MTVKLLTDKRGPLQGISLESILRTAYGPDAVFREGEGEGMGLIVRERPNGDVVVLDTVIDLHDE